ncbi:hypothetical protein NDU88_004765, partial [Pleurodeles waltl]
ENTYTMSAAVSGTYHGPCDRERGPCLHFGGVGALGGWGPTPVWTAVCASRP